MKNAAQPSGRAAFRVSLLQHGDTPPQPLQPVDNVDKWAAQDAADTRQAAAFAVSIIATKRSKR
ncbi:hypothetical protein [Phreatobacter sp.]|uniref:hypothetical protein n=1 Tax=Phreatobacter sp. TaxID=1966341 RepID=UPI00261AF17C|nr:hypothetical protein [Phreatobacter sp.]